MLLIFQAYFATLRETGFLADSAPVLVIYVVQELFFSALSDIIRVPSVSILFHQSREYLVRHFACAEFSTDITRSGAISNGFFNRPLNR